MTHKFSLDDNFHILMQKSNEGKEIYLIDNVLNTKDLIGTFQNSRWSFNSPTIQNDFFVLVNKYKSIFMNNIYKELEENFEKPLNKQFSTLRRKAKIFIKRKL